jgi:hypothetical protein
MQVNRRSVLALATMPVLGNLLAGTQGSNDMKKVFVTLDTDGSSPKIFTILSQADVQFIGGWLVIDTYDPNSIPPSRIRTAFPSHRVYRVHFNGE